MMEADTTGVTERFRVLLQREQDRTCRMEWKEGSAQPDTSRKFARSVPRRNSVTCGRTRGLDLK